MAYIDWLEEEGSALSHLNDDAEYTLVTPADLPTEREKKKIINKFKKIFEK